MHGFHEELYALGPGLSVWYNQRGHWAGLVVFGVSAVLAVASLHIFGVQTHVPGKLLLQQAFHLQLCSAYRCYCKKQHVIFSRSRRDAVAKQHVVEPCTLMLIIGSAGSVCLCSLAQRSKAYAMPGMLWLRRRHCCRNVQPSLDKAHLGLQAKVVLLGMPWVAPALVPLDIVTLKC